MLKPLKVTIECEGYDTKVVTVYPEGTLFKLVEIETIRQYESYKKHREELQMRGGYEDRMTKIDLLIHSFRERIDKEVG